MRSTGPDARRTIAAGGVSYRPDGCSPWRPWGKERTLPEDLLSKIQRELRARLRELEDVVAEHERLSSAAAAFGPPGAGAASASARGARSGAPRPRRTAGRRSAAATRKAPAPSAAQARKRASARPRAVPGRTLRGTPRKRAPRGANRDAILQAARKAPRGAVASQLAREAGVGRVSAYQVLGRLEADGLVRKVEQPGAPTLYVAS